MSEAIIHNWLHHQTLNLSASRLEDSIGYRDGPLVTIAQQGGSMSFQFDMKPEQARAMADALNAMASEAESLEQVVA